MEKRSPTTTRRKVLLLSGLFDCTAGIGLLLIWIGFLPIELDELGIPRLAVGLVGAVLFFPGLALVTHQLTRPPERE